MSIDRQTQILEQINVSFGNSPTGEDPIEKFGRQDDIDTADVTGALTQKIWPIKRATQDYLFIDSPIQLFLKSDNANDSIAGTGAQKVEVIYQDSAGLQQNVVLDMAGLGNVNLPDTSYGCFRMIVQQTGASNVNEGTISIVDGSANIYAVITPGEGQTQISVQRIPNNRTGKIVRRWARYGRTGVNNTADMRLRIRKADGTIITKDDPRISVDNTDYDKRYTSGVSVQSGEWVFWECILVSANNTPIESGFDIILFE